MVRSYVTNFCYKQAKQEAGIPAQGRAVSHGTPRRASTCRKRPRGRPNHRALRENTIKRYDFLVEKPLYRRNFENSSARFPRGTPSPKPRASLTAAMGGGLVVSRASCRTISISLHQVDYGVEI